MDADVEEPGMFYELPLVLSYNCIDRICDLLIVKPPVHKLGPGRGAGSGRDGISLPRVRLTELDLPLRVVAEGRVREVPRTGIDLTVGEGPPRPGKRVYEVPALRCLIAGQNLADQAFGDVGRWHWRTAARRLEQGSIRITDDRDAGLGLQVKPVDVLSKMKLAESRGGWAGVCRGIGTELCRVPIRSRAAELVDTSGVSTCPVERVGSKACTGGYRSRPLRERSQPLRSVRG